MTRKKASKSTVTLPCAGFSSSSCGASSRTERMISKKAEARLRQILSQWGRALSISVEEHGAPNSFGVVELAGEFNLKKRDGYRLGRERLVELQSRVYGFTLTYAKGRFSVL